MKNGTLIIYILLCVSIFLLSAVDSAANVRNMRCEYLVSPMGIDVTEPRLTWELDKADGIQKCFVELSRDSKFSNPLLFPASGLRFAKARINPKAGDRYYWRVVTEDAAGKKKRSATATFETGKCSPEEWKAQWISDSHDTAYEPMSVFRKSFKIKDNPKNARIYVSAVGYYVITLNGKRLGINHMDPGFTDYTKRSLYSVYDVTDLLRKGSNEITVALGNGFANCQSRDSWGQERAPWRSRPKFICEVTDNGNVVAATDSTWQTRTGSTVYTNLYSGDHYDARVKGGDWTNAVVVKAPNDNLVAQKMAPIVPVSEIKPKLIQSWGDTVYLYDMGKNIAGVCRLDIKGKRGTRVEMAHGELLKKNGRLELGNLNIYYHPLKQDEAFQTDVYTLCGDAKGESFQPEFTYHGFRYVELRSSEPIPASTISLTGRQMCTGLDRVGSFRCSNDLLNRIYDATMLSYEDNIHSIPTDCPQREKNGWTADAHVAVDLGLLNYDGIKLYEKWMDDFIDNQRENGNVAGIVPSAGWGYGDSPGPVWDAALFIVPLAIYDYYGDDTALRKLYPTMLRYMGWLKSLRKEDGTLACGIGDWLPYKTGTPTEFTTTLYAFADYKMMSRICSILGKDPSEWNAEAAAMRDRINSKWLDRDKALYANGSQAAQAISLFWGVVPEEYERKVASNLNDMVKNNDYALDFGLLGSKSVLRMLTKYGYTDTAYRMATRTEEPGWGYWIDRLGYTTLAETWTLSPEFRDASLNHVFFGDIAAWMVNDIAGINFDPAKPGFENVIIRPVFFDGIDWAEAKYHSVAGPVSSRWERLSDSRIKLTVEVPAGSTATLDIKGDIKKLKSGKHQLVL